MNPRVDWPRDDYSRVPYVLYHDAEVFEQEREKIFAGPAWSYLALEAELPEPGDFKTTVMGDIPILVSRDRSGAVHAFVNRCAHRGALVRREVRGNARNHTCIYHRWCFALDGQLIACRSATASTARAAWRPTSSSPTMASGACGSAS